MLQQDIQSLQAVLRHITQVEPQSSEEGSWLDTAYTGVQRAIAALQLLAQNREGQTSAYPLVQSKPFIVRESPQGWSVIEGGLEQRGSPFEAVARGMVEGMAGTAFPEVEESQMSELEEGGVNWTACEWVEVESCQKTAEGVDESDRPFEVYVLVFGIKFSNAPEPQRRVYEIPVYRAKDGLLEIGDWQVLEEGADEPA